MPKYGNNKALFKGAYSHYVYCEACNGTRKQKEKARKAKRRKILKEEKVKEENTSILDVFNNVDVSVLGLKPEQVKFVSLRVPFLSQLLRVRCAFPIKLGLVKNDQEWKLVHVEKGLRTRDKPKRSEVLYFHHDYGLKGIGGNWETAIQALLSEHTSFVLKTLFVNLKSFSLITEISPFVLYVLLWQIKSLLSAHTG